MSANRKRSVSGIALVHDWLNQRGGAENVLECLVELFPDAPVYTSMYSPRRMPNHYRTWDIRTSFMQWLPGIASHHQAYMPLYPLAFRSLRLQGHDIVLSNKSAFCHGVRKPGGAVHICYCLTPTRFLWMYESYRQREEISPWADALVRRLLNILRRWDYAAAQQVDHFVAISTAVQTRIRRFYDRDSDVIYPPVDTAHYAPSPGKPDDYYLLVGRLIPYKRADLAVKAFTELGLPLIVVGEGRDQRRLEAIAGPTITFRGWVDHGKELRTLYQRCRAFIFPGLEDFGIAPVEAQASGRPVIAFAGGGALDTVLPGITGALFYEPTPEALAATVRVFDPSDYDPQDCRRNAERFDVQTFKESLLTYVDEHGLSARQGQR